MENVVLNSTVVIACLVVGYLLKNTSELFPNKYIPHVLVVVGAILNAVLCGIVVDNVVMGAAMGLISCVSYDKLFKNFFGGE